MKKILWLLALLPCLCLAEVQQIPQSSQQFIGLSTDTKPVQSISQGALFLETDTGKTYVWKGNTNAPGTSSDWVQFGVGVSLMTLIAGEDQTNDVMKVEGRFSYASDDADLVVKATAGFLHAVSCWPEDATATAGRVQIRDATAAEAGTVVWQDEFAAAEHTPSGAVLDVVMATGIVIDFDTTADVFCTVSYR